MEDGKHNLLYLHMNEVKNELGVSHSSGGASQFMVVQWLVSRSGKFSDTRTSENKILKVLKLNLKLKMRLSPGHHLDAVLQKCMLTGKQVSHAKTLFNM